jgi:hypothetical protein
MRCTSLFTARIHVSETLEKKAAYAAFVFLPSKRLEFYSTASAIGMTFLPLLNVSSAALYSVIWLKFKYL